MLPPITFLPCSNPNLNGRDRKPDNGAGEVLSAQAEIIDETHRFYQDLFTEDHNIADNSREQAVLEDVSLIYRRLGPSQSGLLETAPDMEEIERTVDIMSSKKSPGLDRVTAGVVRELWLKIKNDCRDMILDFRADGRLTVKTKKGLVENAVSVVHINGAVTKEIRLGRGVRQGCPIVPMLFTLSTQPLMQLLKNALVSRLIQGLKAGNGRHVLEALFADDTGLLLQAEEENWRRATEVIHKFEQMSGARLNIPKSIVVPVGFTEPPDWLRTAGCKLAVEGQIWTYLGFLIGVNLTEEQILQWMLDKITKTLNQWTNKIL
ncbi:hypothetical protein R1sor_019856 [Riccia sorocarpa]|uniref:Reverse transcriptase domain-containing protein n=1 Tax=Riccia sorocarpa TaxID=122646 RepID=A0ABD3IH03_9MARC